MVTTVVRAGEFEQLVQGLDETESERLLATVEVARQTSADRALDTGEPFFAHALGMAGIAAELKLDVDRRYRRLC